MARIVWGILLILFGGSFFFGSLASCLGFGALSAISNSPGLMLLPLFPLSLGLAALYFGTRLISSGDRQRMHDQKNIQSAPSPDDDRPFTF